VSSPVLFPFSLEEVTPYVIEGNGRLCLYRQGLDKDVVMLRASCVPNDSLAAILLRGEAREGREGN